eukprot:g11860.t1
MDELCDRLASAFKITDVKRLNDIKALLYADDVALIAHSRTELQKMVNVVAKFAEDYRLEVNLKPGKTEIMPIYTSSKAKRPSIRERGEIQARYRLMCWNQLVGAKLKKSNVRSRRRQGRTVSDPEPSVQSQENSQEVLFDFDYLRSEQDQQPSTGSLAPHENPQARPRTPPSSSSASSAFSSPNPDVLSISEVNESFNVSGKRVKTKVSTVCRITYLPEQEQEYFRRSQEGSAHSEPVPSYPRLRVTLAPEGPRVYSRPGDGATIDLWLHGKWAVVLEPVLQRNVLASLRYVRVERANHVQGLHDSLDHPCVLILDESELNKDAEIFCHNWKQTYRHICIS